VEAAPVFRELGTALGFGEVGNDRCEPRWISSKPEHGLSTGKLPANMQRSAPNSSRVASTIRRLALAGIGTVEPGLTRRRGGQAHLAKFRHMHHLADGIARIPFGLDTDRAASSRGQG